MLAVVNGDYERVGNGLRQVSSEERQLRRVVMKLTARRGQFPFMEEFGSRLWTLGRLKAAERQSAAEQYVAEALADEAGLRVERVTLSDTADGGMTLTAELYAEGKLLTAEVALG